MTAGKLLLANTSMDANRASASGGAVYVAGAGHLQVLVGCLVGCWLICWMDGWLVG